MLGLDNRDYILKSAIDTLISSKQGTDSLVLVNDKFLWSAYYKSTQELQKSFVIFLDQTQNQFITIKNYSANCQPSDSIYKLYHNNLIRLQNSRLKITEYQNSWLVRNRKPVPQFKYLRNLLVSETESFKDEISVELYNWHKRNSEISIRNSSLKKASRQLTKNIRKLLNQIKVEKKEVSKQILGKV